MNERANRDVREGQAVARADFRCGARNQRVTNADVERRDDVALLAICIMQEGQARRAVRVILDRGDLGRNAKLLALEIDLADKTAIATAAMPDGHAAIGVASTMAAERNGQCALGGRLGDLFKGVARHPALTGSRGLIFLDGHYFTPSKISRVWPSASVTIAFLNPDLRTSKRRDLARRPRLAGVLRMLTEDTVTSNMVSTASLTIVRVAFGATSNEYWLSLPDWRLDFSVTRGRRRTS